MKRTISCFAWDEGRERGDVRGGNVKGGNVRGDVRGEMSEGDVKGGDVRGECQREMFEGRCQKGKMSEWKCQTGNTCIRGVCRRGLLETLG